MSEYGVSNIYKNTGMLRFWRDNVKGKIFISGPIQNMEKSNPTGKL